MLRKQNLLKKSKSGAFRNKQGCPLNHQGSTSCNTTAWVVQPNKADEGDSSTPQLKTLAQSATQTTGEITGCQNQYWQSLAIMTSLDEYYLNQYF